MTKNFLITRLIPCLLYLPSPFFLSRPHGGLGVPAAVADRLAVDETTLFNEADFCIDTLFDFAHPSLVPLLPPGHGLGTLGHMSTQINRAFIDVNRPPDALHSADGPVKTHSSYGARLYREPLPQPLRRELLQRYWQPYHERTEQSLCEYSGELRLLLDCHNMAQRSPAMYQYPNAQRPLVCVSNMGDLEGNAQPDIGWVCCPPGLARDATEIAAQLFADLALVEPDTEPDEEPPAVATLNWPFHGGYIIYRYSKQYNICDEEKAAAQQAPYRTHAPTLMIEVNRGLYVGNQTAGSPIVEPEPARIDAIRERLYHWAVRVLALLDEKNYD